MQQHRVRLEQKIGDNNNNINSNNTNTSKIEKEESKQQGFVTSDNDNTTKSGIVDNISMQNGMTIEGMYDDT